ncbi:transcription factor Cys6 [Purpureocillium lavendulum]|uniref:Transcription factor Cys6 n=1 Tax=Purpureocillium lavendulum TaxID=1247861 RepID=A0AB34FL65_9HYPO|nr:transcription factor Cys6 [Purpureocillium lavendulum]
MPGCDQARPACSRCARLNIACIGCGQQRFKFKDETPNLRAADKQLSRRPPATARAATAGALLDPSRALTNPTALTAGAFVSVLEITDPRYDLFCYGTFMNEIPLQLGRHEALDASAEALASCFSCVHTGNVSTSSIGKYVRALNAVQKCLQNPATAYSGETLCAIYLIMLVQVSSPRHFFDWRALTISKGWIGKDDDSFPQHGQAMAHLLGVVVARELNDPRSAVMLITLTVSVLLESIFNPDIQLEPWLSTLAEAHRPAAPVQNVEGVVVTCLELQNMSLMTEILRHPMQHISQMRSLYQIVRLDFPGLRKHLLEIIEPACSGPLEKLPLVLVRLQTRYQAAYCLLLSMGMTLNGMLRALNPYDLLLGEEMDTYCAEMLDLAERAKGRRPFGASHIPLGLLSAWAAVDDESQRPAIRSMIAEYDVGFASVNWQAKAELLRPAYDTVRRRLAVYNLSSPDPGDVSDDSGCAMEDLNCMVAYKKKDACCIL